MFYNMCYNCSTCSTIHTSSMASIHFRCSDEIRDKLIKEAKEDKVSLTELIISKLVSPLSKVPTQTETLILLNEKIDNLEIYIADQASIINKHTTRQINSLSQR